MKKKLKRLRNLIGVFGALSLLVLGVFVPGISDFILETGALACFALLFS